MFEHVYEGIYIGSLDCLHNQNTVYRAGIRAVLRLDEADRSKLQWDERFKVADLSFTDGEAIPDDILDKTTAFLHEQVENEVKVLVHCAAGVSRSVTIVMAYLIAYEHMTLAEAFQTVKEGRSVAYPHEILLVSLIEHYALPYDVSKVYNPPFLSQLMRE